MISTFKDYTSQLNRIEGLASSYTGEFPAPVKAEKDNKDVEKRIDALEKELTTQNILIRKAIDNVEKTNKDSIRMLIQELQKKKTREEVKIDVPINIEKSPSTLEKIKLWFTRNI